jgi:ATP-binding cassette, subfamily C, bacterial CydC
VIFLGVALWFGLGGAGSPIIDGLILVSIAAAITASGRLVKTLAAFDHDLVWLRGSLSLIDNAVIDPGVADTAGLRGAQIDRSAPIIVDGLRFAYGSAGRNVLEIDALSIAPGESVAVVGRTGAGKSTLLKLLSGVLVPSAGSIRVAGVAPSDLGAAEFGDVFQILPQEPVSLPGRVRDSFFRVELDAAVVLNACKLAEVDAVTLAALDQPAGTALAAVDVARLKLASIVASPAPVVVLDEPTAALDEPQSHDFTRRLLRLAAGRTVLMVTHNVRLRDYFDRCVVLESAADAAATPAGVMARMTPSTTQRHDMDIYGSTS